MPLQCKVIFRNSQHVSKSGERHKQREMLICNQRHKFRFGSDIFIYLFQLEQGMSTDEYTEAGAERRWSGGKVPGMF